MLIGYVQYEIPMAVTRETIDSWDERPFRLVPTGQCFGGICCTLKEEAIYQTTKCCIPKNRNNFYKRSLPFLNSQPPILIYNATYLNKIFMYD